MRPRRRSPDMVATRLPERSPTSCPPSRRATRTPASSSPHAGSFAGGISWPPPGAFALPDTRGLDVQSVSALTAGPLAARSRARTVSPGVLRSSPLQHSLSRCPRLFESSRSATPARRRAARPAPRPAAPRLEALEDRQVLSITLSVAPNGVGTIVIQGSGHADVVRVFESFTAGPNPLPTYRVTLRNGIYPGEDASFLRDKVQRISFKGYAGDDTFTNETYVPSVALGGSGNDRLVGGGSVDYLSGGALLCGERDTALPGAA